MKINQKEKKLSRPKSAPRQLMRLSKQQILPQNLAINMKQKHRQIKYIHCSSKRKFQILQSQTVKSTSKSLDMRFPSHLSQTSQSCKNTYETLNSILKLSSSNFISNNRFGANQEFIKIFTSTPLNYLQNNKKAKQSIRNRRQWQKRFEKTKVLFREQQKNKMCQKLNNLYSKSMIYHERIKQKNVKIESAQFTPWDKTPIGDVEPFVTVISQIGKR